MQHKQSTVICSDVGLGISEYYFSYFVSVFCSH